MFVHLYVDRYELQNFLKDPTNERLEGRTKELKEEYDVHISFNVNKYTLEPTIYEGIYIVEKLGE